MAKSIKPRLAKGTRDFSPTEMGLRNYIIGTIQQCFENFGFEQIETPAVENLETLTGKYGDEGDKLIFKILNSGDYLSKVDDELLKSKESDKVIPHLAEKALRYDLTVPFARYVVQHRNDITFPFRRFQVQPVWRADRPQKGRYREFYQCDADVIGSDSLLIEAEFIKLIDEVFKQLKIPSVIKINSRKVLYGFCEEQGITDQFVNFTTLIDKLDKKPWESLKEDFQQEGFSQNTIDQIKNLIDVSGNAFNESSLSDLEKIVGSSSLGIEGVKELRDIASYLSKMSVDYVDVVLDLSLARGLNYYTGAIIEVVAKDIEMGSICGGGRYDDLTGIFGLNDVSGIGISFGIDRLFDIIKERGWKDNGTLKRVLLVNFGENDVPYALEMLSELRNAGISSEIYPDSDKLKKQFKYADSKNFHFVLIAGKEEREKNVFSLKNLQSGEQKELEKSNVLSYIQNS